MVHLLRVVDQWHDVTLPATRDILTQNTCLKQSLQQLCDLQPIPQHEQGCSSTDNMHGLNSCAHLYHTFLSSCYVTWVGHLIQPSRFQWHWFILIYSRQTRCNRHWMMTETNLLKTLQVRDIHSCSGKYWHEWYLFKLNVTSTICRVSIKW